MQFKISAFLFLLLTVLSELFGAFSMKANATNAISPVRIIWEKTFHGEVVGYPLVDSENCYLSFIKSGKLYVEARSLKDGKAIWQTILPHYEDILPLKQDTQTLFVAVNSSRRGALYALDKRQGSVNWDFKGKFLILGKEPPFILNRAELILAYLVKNSQMVFVALGASRLVALDSKTGGNNWDISLGYRWAQIRLHLADNRLYWKVGGWFFRAIDPESGQTIASPLPPTVETQIKESDGVYAIDDKRIFLRVKEVSADQIVCFDLNTGAKKWQFEDEYLFPVKAEGNALFARYRPKGAKRRLFKQQYFLIALDGPTGKPLWNIPSEPIDFIQKKGPYVLTKYANQNCQLIDFRNGAVLWDSEKSTHKKGGEKNNFCMLNEIGSHFLYVTDHKIFWMKINALNKSE